MTSKTPKSSTEMKTNPVSPTYLGIKSWAEEDRPREKLMLKGKENLSNAELLAILIGSGSRSKSAVELCKEILQTADHNLHILGKRNISDLMQFKGIGEAKAISIIAAMELGRRRRLAEVAVRTKIGSSRDIFELFHPIMSDLPHEEFWIIYLNRSNSIQQKERISIGGVSGTVADVKIIFKKAIQQLSSAIIAVHNHPSGTLRPSKADILLTNKLREAGKFLDIRLLDHVIITEAGYYSFADEGMLQM